MSVPQWILLALVAVVTTCGFASMISILRYTFTARNIAVALVMPLAWAALIAMPPWSAWSATLQIQIPTLLNLLSILALLGATTAAILLVVSIIVWMDAAITDDWSNIRDMMPKRRRP